MTKAAIIKERVERKTAEEKARMDQARKRPATSKRMVQDPSMSDAEYYHQQSAEFQRARNRNRAANTDVGKVPVDERLSTRIGGLAYIRRREEHHEKAAERFINEYESAYGSQAGALDPGRVQVDTSPVAHDSGMGARVDRNRALGDTLREMEPQDRDILIAVLVLGEPIRNVSVTPHWRHQGDSVKRLLATLDALAIQWGYLVRRELPAA